MERLLVLLRWIALAIALLLNLWGLAPAGFLHEPETAIVALALYNAAVSVTLYRWGRPSPRRLLLLDSAVFMTGVVAAGGWHSSLFVLFFLTTLTSAVQLGGVASLGYTAAVSLLYMVACVLLPNWSWEPATIEVLIGRVTSLLFTALITAGLVQQVSTERRLRESEEDLNARLTVLNELTSFELDSKLDLNKTLEGIARLARRAINAEFSAVCLFPSQDHHGCSFAFDGIPLLQQPGLFRDAHLDPVGEVVARTGEPLLIADVSRSGNGNWNRPSSASGLKRWRTLVCVPIKLGDTVIGVLYNGVKSPGQVRKSDVDLLAAMSRHTALAIVNAQMYDRERGNVERLKKLEQMKSDFLSAVSHQLRTPITSIATAADLLRASSTNLSEDQRKLVHNVARNTVRLDNLVTDLLQMARLKEGRVQLSCQATSPLSLANEAVAGVKLLFDARDQTVEIEVDPALPKVQADRKKVGHVLANLLTNACNFTQRGGLIVVDASERGGAVEFAVRDNGPGVRQEIRDRVFEPFFSAHGPEGQGGTGLGLAIARGIVELHGGHISLESSPGAGTTVRFTLPAIRNQKSDIRGQLVADI